MMSPDISTSSRTTPTRRIRFIAICVAVFFFVFYYLYPTFANGDPRDGSLSSAQNRTLGFGAIYVLTEDASTWRVEGLKQAAKLTGIDLQIPVQQHRSDQEVYDHLFGNEAITDFNEIKALLNYIALLEKFIQAGHETALFLEDDVDFSVNIKGQMERISQTIFEHRRRPPTPEDEGYVSSYPYGEEWDVFWIGHFGIEYSGGTESWYYNDPYALPWDHLTSEWNELYENEAHITHKTRAQRMYLRVAPMATYAFALNRATAQNLIDLLRVDRAQRFDLALHMHCKGVRYECLAPVPEVMHHHQVDGGTSLGKSNTQDHGGGKYDLKWWRRKHKYTYNINWSARCNAAGVGERVEEGWQCLPGRYDPYLNSNKYQVG